MIPRILHQIWVGPDPLPDDFKSYQQSWRRHHPDWEVRLWTEENLPADLRRPEALDRLRLPVERSDILRHDLLYRFGGVYADVDFEWRRALDPILDGVAFFTADLKPGRVNNALIGSVPEHPITDRAIRELVPRDSYGAFDKKLSGSLFWDRIIKDCRTDITIFPPAYFYPDSPEDREAAYAIHHKARTWQDAAGFREAAVRAEERLDKLKGQLEKERRAHEKTKRELEALRAAARTPVSRPNASHQPHESAGQSSPRRALFFKRSR